MESTVIVIVVAGVALGIFALLREFWCWYWKINERNKLLTSINGKLDRLSGISETTAAEAKSSKPAKRTSYYDDNEPVNMEKIVPK